MKWLILAFFLLLPILGNCTSGGNNTYTVSAPLTTQIDYNGGTNAVWVGRAAAGAATSEAMWQIEYITYNATGEALSVTWSPNYRTFGDIWASHSTLTYS